MSYGTETTNEIGRQFLELNAAQGAVALTPLFGVNYPTSSRGTACRPSKMLLNIEGGDIRYTMTNGDAPTSAFGTLGRVGTDIDWTDPAMDYTSLIKQFRVCAVSGQVVLNISYRD